MRALLLVLVLAMPALALGQGADYRPLRPEKPEVKEKRRVPPTTFRFDHNGGEFPSAVPPTFDCDFSKWDGGPTLDCGGVTFARQGTPTPLQPTGYWPAGFAAKDVAHNAAGFPSGTEHKQTSGAAIFNTTGPVRVCVIYDATKTGSSNQNIIGHLSSIGGFEAFINWNGELAISSSATGPVYATQTHAPFYTPGLNVGCVGRVGTNFYANSNFGTTGTGTGYAEANASMATIGSGLVNGKVYEVKVDFVPWNEAEVYAMQARAMRCTRPGACWDDDANTVSHVTFTATGAPVDSRGLAWSTVGTLTPSSAPYRWPSGLLPGMAAGAKFDGVDDYFDGGDTLDPIGSFTVCSQFKASSVSNNAYVLGKAVGGVNSYAFYRGSSEMLLQVWDAVGGMSYIVTSGLGLSVGQGVTACGSYLYAGPGQSVLRLQVNTTVPDAVTNAVGPIVDSVVPLRIGADGTGAGNLFAGDLARVTMFKGWAAPASDLARMVNALQARQGTLGEPLTYTSNATTACAGPTCWNVPAGVPAIEEKGLVVEPGGTNYVMQSEDIADVSALRSPWVAAGALVVLANQSIDPFGAQTMDRISNEGGTNTDAAYQVVSVPSSVGPFTGSAFVAAATGTSDQTIRVQCPGVGNSVAACTCSVSSGTCATAMGADKCAAWTTAGTTPVRLAATATCALATTGPYMVLEPGKFSVSTGTGYFGLAQFENSAVPGTYHRTVGNTVSWGHSYGQTPNPVDLTKDHCVEIFATMKGMLPAGAGRWQALLGSSNTFMPMMRVDTGSGNDDTINYCADNGTTCAIVTYPATNKLTRTKYVGRKRDGQLQVCANETCGSWRTPGTLQANPDNLTIGTLDPLSIHVSNARIESVRFYPNSECLP